MVEGDQAERERQHQHEAPAGCRQQAHVAAAEGVSERGLDHPRPDHGDRRRGPCSDDCDRAHQAELDLAEPVEIVVGGTSSERRKERGLHRLEEEQWDSRDDQAIEEDPWRLLTEFVPDDGERNRPNIEKKGLRDRGGEQQAESWGELVEVRRGPGLTNGRTVKPAANVPRRKAAAKVMA